MSYIILLFNYKPEKIINAMFYLSNQNHLGYLDLSFKDFLEFSVVDPRTKSQRIEINVVYCIRRDFSLLRSKAYNYRLPNQKTFQRLHFELNKKYRYKILQKINQLQNFQKIPFFTHASIMYVLQLAHFCLSKNHFNTKTC